MLRRGREFVQLPGPTNIPERVLRAAGTPATDFSSPEFSALTRSCLADLKRVFGTNGEVFAFASLGHGAWEAALTNLFAPGDSVLVPYTGRFSESWRQMAEVLGIRTISVEGDARRAIDPAALADALHADHGRKIAGVLVVHIETSTGVVNDLPALRAALDHADHPALFVVDAVASLAVSDLRMDEWRIDAALAASQKGLMLPPGLSFLALGQRALARAHANGGIRRYFDVTIRHGAQETYGLFYGTPPVQLLRGLREALDMLFEEGLAQVFARHRRLARAVRAAVARWAEAGAIDFFAREPAERSDAVTAIDISPVYRPDELRAFCRDRLSVAIGGGLPPFTGRMLRIGHLGDLNEPMVLGALGALELAFRIHGVPHAPGGVEAAVAALAASHAEVGSGLGPAATGTPRADA